MDSFLCAPILFYFLTLGLVMLNFLMNYIFLPPRLGDLIASLPIVKRILNDSTIFNLYLSPGQKEFLKLLEIPNLTLGKIITVRDIREYITIRNNRKHGKINIYDLSGFTYTDGEVNYLNYYYYGGLTEVFSIWGLNQKLCIPPNLPLKASIFKDCLKIHNKFKLPSEYIVVHRFSLDKSRTINKEVIDSFLKRLLNLLKIPIIDLGSLQDKKESPLNIPKMYYYDLRGKTSLIELICIIKRASFFVGVDSFLSHLANVFKIKGAVFLGRFMGRYTKYLPYCGFYRKKTNLYILRYTTGPLSEMSADNLDFYFYSFKEWFFNKKEEGLYNPYDKYGAYKFLNFIQENDRFILWGAGLLGDYCYRFLKSLGKQILFFIDTNKTGSIYNIPIISPKNLQQKQKLLKGAKILICTAYGWYDVARFLEFYGLVHFKDFI